MVAPRIDPITPEYPALPIQIGFSVAYLAAYLGMSVLYQRRWDATLRARPGRRIGTRIGWTRHGGYADPFSTDMTPARFGGGAGPQAGVVQRLAVWIADFVVGTVLGVAPVVLYILIAFFAGLIHPLVGAATLFAFMPIFGIWWAGHYRWHGADTARS